MLSQSDLDRFMYYVEKTDTCWLWKGGIAKCGGHGIFSLHAKTRKAHAVLLAHTLGRPLHDGYQANHRCSTKHCVRPDHVYEGTQVQNIQDMIKDNTVPKGQCHWNSKLTESQVLAIRKDQRSRQEIAAEYQIAPNYVSQIRKRRVWSHLPLEVPKATADPGI
jgi:hypothetical protein